MGTTTTKGTGNNSDISFACVVRNKKKITIDGNTGLLPSSRNSHEELHQ